MIIISETDLCLERETMAKCRECGKELPKIWSTDICLECSKANIKQIFKENPELKQAFKETVEELKKPENVKKMAEDTAKFMQAVQSAQSKG